MAKARTSAVQVYRPPATSQAPVIRISTPRPVVAKKASRGRRRGGGGAGNSDKHLMGKMVAAGLLGVVKSNGLLDKLPSLPVVGRIGAAAIASHLVVKYGGGGEMMRDVRDVAAVIAMYQLGSQGSIDGEDDGDGDGDSLAATQKHERKRNNGAGLRDG